MRTALLIIGLVAPLATRAQAASDTTPPERIVADAGNQTAPSIATRFVAYLDEASATPTVKLRYFADGSIETLPTDGLPHGAPDTWGDYVAYRVPGRVKVYSAFDHRVALDVAAPGSGRTAIAAGLVAWDQDAADGGDVAWQRFDGVAPVLLARAGRQRAVAAAGDWLVFVDDADGTVRLLDTRLGATAPDTILFTGAPLDVAVSPSADGSAPTVAVTASVQVAGALDTVVVVIGGSGAELRRLDTRPGEKQNPHLSGEWVGFEFVLVDPLGGPASRQVMLWNWQSLAIRTPWAQGTNQRLHDLVASTDAIAVAWADDAGSVDGLFDILLKRLSAQGGGTTPGPAPARCDDPKATILADLSVVRAAQPTKLSDDDRDDDDRDDHGDADHDDDDGHHGDDDHHDGHHGDHHGLGHPAFGWASFPVDAATPVLVCIEAKGVTAAWVGAGRQLVATPADFVVDPAALEARLVLAPGEGRVGALVAGGPGATVRVRVLADLAADPTTGTTPGRPLPVGIGRHHGCSSSGGAGAAALLAVIGLLAVAPRRRPRR